MDTLLLASATELARRIRAGELRASDVVAAHLDHARRVNPALNAIVNPLYEQAAAQAEAVAPKARDAKARPFLGVPCTIKENFAFAGMPQASGLVSRQGLRSEVDAPTVARIKASGAIPIGTTNTSELCMWMESNNRVYGRSNNPYNPRHIVGGSSGGEGAIIGSGASAFGLGADVGGSIRMPAFFNGVFGHKPSPGLVPNDGQVPLPTGDIDRYCVTGPLARRAEDLEPLLRLLAGDAATGLPPIDAVDLGRLRLLSIPGNGRHRVHPELRDAQQEAFDALAGEFASARRLRLPALKYSFEVWSARMKMAGGESFAEQLANGAPLSLPAELGRWSVRRSPHTLPALALAAVEKLPLPHGRNLARGEALQAAMDDLLGDDGVLLYPSYSVPAPRHYTPMLRTFHWSYCGVLNVLEMPATQVPLGLSQRGLPLGLQVAARRGNDHLCLAVARRLEQLFGGWRPPPRLQAAAGSGARKGVAAAR